MYPQEAYDQVKAEMRKHLPAACREYAEWSKTGVIQDGSHLAQWRDVLVKVWGSWSGILMLAYILGNVAIEHINEASKESASSLK